MVICGDFTDVTLAGEDSNSLPSGESNRARQAAPPGGQNCNQWGWCHLVVKPVNNVTNRCQKRYVLYVKNFKIRLCFSVSVHSIDL